MKRIWYVQSYLVPSMIEQGIPKDHIRVYLDKNRIGNLRAFIDSCNRLNYWCDTYDINGVWHLQDDVIICKNFAEKTELLDDAGLVCGFTCDYEEKPQPGTFLLSEEKMWFSFPCIRIPTSILKEFTNWANLNLWQSNYFRESVRRNNADDLVFREWLYDNYGNTTHLNVAPNLVNHIDDLLDGSVVSPHRTANTRSLFWEDDDLVGHLKCELDKRKNI